MQSESGAWCGSRVVGDAVVEVFYYGNAEEAALELKGEVTAFMQAAVFGVGELQVFCAAGGEGDLDEVYFVGCAAGIGVATCAVGVMMDFVVA